MDSACSWDINRHMLTKSYSNFSFNPSFQGVSPYGWQTAGNMLTLISALIAAGLYGNIGIKVFYNNVLMDAFVSISIGETIRIFETC